MRASDVDPKRVPAGNTYGAVAGLPFLRSYVFGFELDPPAERGAVRLLDLRGGSVPPVVPTEDSRSEPRFLVDHDLEGATTTLDGRPLEHGARVVLPRAGFTLDVVREVKDASGAPFRRHYVRRYEPRDGFDAGTCRIEVSEGVIGADFLLAGAERADRAHGCVAPSRSAEAGGSPCSTFRSCGSTMTLERVETVP